MGVDHRGADILMAEEFLDGTHIIAILQQMRGKAMAQGVTTAALRESGALDGVLHGFLQDGFGEMMPAFDT